MNDSEIEKVRNTFVGNGRYRVESVLGAQPGQAVYKVLDLQCQAPLVLKIFRSPHRSDSPAARAFAEFERMAGVDFPSIVPVVDCGLDVSDGAFYFTSRYVEGGDFLTALSGVSFDRMLPVIGHILRALDFLHRNRVVHGDLKPSNILVEERNGELIPWILDFGLARTIHDPLDRGASGTLLYMAPEVIEGSAPGVAADLYSLGLMIWEHLHGALPFDRSTPERSILERLEGLALRAETPRGVPAAFLNLMDKLLKRDPDQRYGAAREVLRDLGDFSEKGCSFVTRATLSGLVRSAVPGQVEEDLTKAFGALQIGAKADRASMARPVFFQSSAPGARLLGERIRFAAASLGVRSAAVSVAERDEADGRALWDAIESALRGRFHAAQTASASDFRRKLASKTLERALRGDRGFLLVLYVDTRPVAGGTVQKILEILNALRAAGTIDLALFATQPVDDPSLLGWRAGEVAERIPVGRLARDDVGPFVSTLFEWGSTPSSLLALLCPSERTDLVRLREMLIYLVASEIIGYEMGDYRFHESRLARASVDGLDRLMDCSLESLSDGERALVERLSVFSIPLSIDLLRSLFPGEEWDNRTLLSLRDRGLVIIERSGEELVASLASFALRSLVYEGLRPERRVGFHGDAARILLSESSAVTETEPGAPPGGRDLRREEIAIHLARGNDVDRAVPWILDAVDRCIACWDFARAYSLADEALRMEALGASPDAFRVHYIKGRIDAHSGRVDEAARRYDEARNLAQRAGAEPVDVGLILAEKAKVFVQKGENDRIIECCEELLALDLPDTQRGRYRRAEAKSHMAYALYRRHELERAHGELVDALALMGSSDSELRAAACNRLGTVLFALGRFDEAEVEYRESIRIYEARAESVQARGPYYNLGRILKARGCKAEAVDLMKAAADLSREKDDTYSVCTTLTGMASACLDLGDAAASREYALEALNVSEELGSKRNSAFVYGTLGETALLEGDPQRANEFYDKCAAIWSALNDEKSVAKICLLRAEREIWLDRLGSAGEWLEKARPQTGDSGAGADHANFCRVDALCALGAGRLEDAIAAVDRGLAALSTMPASEMVFLLRNLRAKALVALGRGQEALDEAQGVIESLPAGVAAPIASAVQITRCAALRLLSAPEEDTLRRALAALDTSCHRHIVAEGYLELARTLHSVKRESGSFQDLQTVLQVLEKAGRLAESVKHAGLQREIKKEEARLVEAAPAAAGKELDTIRKLSDLERLQELTQIINSELDLKKLLDLIVDTAIEMTGALRGFIILVKARQLNFATARHISEEDINDPEFEVSHSIAKNVALSGEPILTSNAQTDHRFRDAVSISELNLLSVLCVPLKTRESLLGSLYIDNPKTISAFNEYDLKMMTSFATQAGIALGNAALLDENMERQAELASSKAEIERLNQRLEIRVEDQARELVSIKDTLEAKQRQLELKYRYDNIITQSSAMIEVLKVLDRITPTDFPVMILGESGTGKELVARSIHYNGPRKRSNFVSLNCAAVVEPLIEAELFGFKKGAFTGAVRDKAGLFEQADRGTLFLDEVGDMSVEVQKRLLRVLQFGEFMRVGDKKVVKVDVRIISATNKDIHSLVQEGSFREDLFYRLNTAVVTLPPLRDRLDDVALLIDHFATLHSSKNEGPATAFDGSAIDELRRREWKGNVRELENAVRKLISLAPPGSRLGRREILSQISSDQPDPQEAASLKESLEAFEREKIIKALQLNGGNKTKTAKELGVSLRGLYKKLDKYGIS